MKKISPYSRKIWTINGLIATGIFLVIAIILNIFLEFNAIWKYVLTFSIYGLALLILIDSWFMPKYRYRKFRYDVDDEKIIIRYGVFTERNVVIPMKSVQYVKTEQGIILRKYKLINLKVHTGGGHHIIPYLESEAGKSAEQSIAKILQEKSI